MKLVRLTLLLIATAGILLACGKDESNANGAKSEIDSSNSTLLSLVPADTPYLAGNVAGIPDEIIDGYLQRFQPALAALQAELSKLRTGIEGNPEELQDDPAKRILHALLMELDGKLNRAGIESLGFDLNGQSVVYGVSAFPVMRTSLSDAAALRATVQRILDKSGAEAPSLEFQGQDYWRISPKINDESGSEIELAIYVAILPDHLAAALLPVSSEDELLPGFLAMDKPAQSTAESQLRAINQRFTYTPYGSGVLDLQKLTAELLDSDSLAGKLLTQAGHDLSAAAGEQCRGEIDSIIARTPRIYTGMQELSLQAIKSQLVVETEKSLAAEMVTLLADVPVADSNATQLLDFALGLKVGPLRDFLRNKAMAVVESPYQCEYLLSLNEQADRAAQQLNQPMPPLVNNLLGLRVNISSFSRGMTAPDSAEGLIALHVSQPEMLVGMAQMLLPNLAELKLAAGDPPVQLPQDLIPVPGMVVYAAQSKTAVGLSVGEGEQARLTGYLEQKSNSDGSFLSANYDSATYMKMTRQMSSDQDFGKEIADLESAIQEIYDTTIDRQDLRILFTKDGLVIDSGMSFKDQ